jgi:hypothetical protein
MPSSSSWVPDVRRSTATKPVITAPPSINGAHADKVDTTVAAAIADIMIF